MDQKNKYEISSIELVEHAAEKRPCLLFSPTRLNKLTFSFCSATECHTSRSDVTVTLSSFYLPFLHFLSVEHSHIPTCSLQILGIQ